MKEYNRVLEQILNKGVWKDNRTGVPCLTIANTMFQHDMSEGFPLLTSRKLPIKSTLVELEGFLKGITSKKWYESRNCLYWSYWSNPQHIDINHDNFKLYQKENDDLGPIYGFNWRSFNKSYQPLPTIHTDFDKTITINTNSKSKYIGKEVETKFGVAVVIDVIRTNHTSKLKLKFKKSGYELICGFGNFARGQIKDPYYPFLYDSACIGASPQTSKWFKKLKLTWYNIISRCYNKKDKDYDNYGGAGVYVSNRWLIMENFLADVEKIPGWTNKLLNWKEYTLDKDYNGGKCYSLDNCVWINKSEQSSNTSKTIKFIAIDPVGNQYYSYNLLKFARKNNLDPGDANRCCNGHIDSVNGWKIIKQEKKASGSVDQLRNILSSLKNNPNDRRMVCSAWNPNQQDQMALPPCHFSWGVIHIAGKLNLWWAQRSCDYVLGVPANISSYATLLLLLCKFSGFTPGTLTGYLCDTHIYQNHLDGVKLQLERELRPLPTLTITHEAPFDLNNPELVMWTHKDYQLSNYDPHPAIKYEVAV